jgi:16S rRNA (uracil1498-N3)-methyltransferase
VDDLQTALSDVDHILVFDENGGAAGVGEALDAAGARSEDAVAVVVGPEGGLTDAEVAALVEAGALRVTLGPTVLRSETAGAVAVALTAYELGGLGGLHRG